MHCTCKGNNCPVCTPNTGYIGFQPIWQQFYTYPKCVKCCWCLAGELENHRQCCKCSDTMHKDRIGIA